MTDFVTIKTSKAAKKLLALIAALTGEKMYAVMERVLSAEFAKVQKRAK